MSRLDDYCPPASPIVGSRNDNRSPVASWRARGIPDWLMWYTFAGACRIRYDGGEIISPAGEAVLIAPRTPHDYGTAPGQERWGVTWVVFQPPVRWREAMRWPTFAPGMMRAALGPDARAQVAERLEQAQTLSRSAAPRRDALAMNALEAALLWCANALGTPMNDGIDRRLKRAVDFLCECLEEPIDLAATAEVAGVSAAHLSRLFRRYLGTSPQRFLEERRLERARDLLRVTSLPVKDIAGQVGFASQFYFSLRFKKRTGFSPSAFREREAR